MKQVMVNFLSEGGHERVSNKREEERERDQESSMMTFRSWTNTVTRIGSVPPNLDSANGERPPSPRLREVREGKRSEATLINGLTEVEEKLFVSRNRWNISSHLH